jgi:hypothetical protein
VGENPATPFIEVVIDTERPAGYPRVAVDPQFLADFGLPSAVGFCPRNDLGPAAPTAQQAQRRGDRCDRSRSSLSGRLCP